MTGTGEEQRPRWEHLPPGTRLQGRKCGCRVRIQGSSGSAYSTTLIVRDLDCRVVGHREGRSWLVLFPSLWRVLGSNLGNIIAEVEGKQEESS